MKYILLGLIIASLTACQGYKPRPMDIKVINGWKYCATIFYFEGSIKYGKYYWCPGGMPIM